MVDWLKCFLIFTTNDWLNDKEMGYDGNNICRIQSTYASLHRGCLIKFIIIDEKSVAFCQKYKTFLKPSACNSCYDTEDIPAILAIPDTLFFLPAFPFSDYCLKHRKAQFVEYQPKES